MPIPTLIIGLPHVRPGPILDRARRLGLPVLISANALAVREVLFPHPHRRGNVNQWAGWDLRRLHLLDGLAAHLDSAGFVAMMRYGGYDFTPEAYIGGPCAAYPWRWFASMDLCVEPSIAPTREAMDRRIAGTVNLYGRCRREAERLGIADRLMPVLQGHAPDDYLRCLDMLPLPARVPILGVGSVCRRNKGALREIEAIVRHLDDALRGTDTKLHLFGVKSEAGSAVADIGRVASMDSQAYGSAARWNAGKAGVSKTDAMVANCMEGWAGRQIDLLENHRPVFQRGFDFAPPPPRLSSLEQRIVRIREELNDLVASGEIEHDAVTEEMIWQCLAAE